MHKIKINVGNLSNTYTQITPIKDSDHGYISAATAWEDSAYSFTMDTVARSFKANEKVYFKREDGRLSYEDNSSIQTTDLISADTYETVCDGFNTRRVYIDSVGYNDDMAIIRFSNDHVHIIDGYPWDDTYRLSDEVDDDLHPYFVKRCKWDIRIFDGLAYHYDINSDGSEYTDVIKESGQKNDFLNRVVRRKFALVLTEGLADILHQDNKFTDVTAGSYMELVNCIVPVDYNGVEDETSIYWAYSGGTTYIDGEAMTLSSTIWNKIVDHISSNWVSHFIIERDERFMSWSESGEYLGLTDGTGIYRLDGDPRVCLSLGDSFAMNLQQQDLLQNAYTEQEIQKNINPIIDYERQIFTPVYEVSGRTSYVKDITFNLHFLKRSDFDTWNADEGEYWYGCNTNIDGSINTTAFNPDYGDLVGNLGFDDDDVYYRKNKVKKSFIRLLFYDSPYKNNQILQFYSTMFLDSGTLYGNYVKMTQNEAEAKVEYEDKNGDVDWTFYEPTDADLRLGCQFKCTDKYDTDYSSEGFYLYLYPNLVEGSAETTLYMKIEFNNAKYGVSVPMTMPDGKPGDSDFPLSYRDDKGGVDMKSLLEDMYVPVSIKYDFEKREYVWILPNATSESATFNLYEPLVNGVIK